MVLEHRAPRFAGAGDRVAQAPHRQAPAHAVRPLLGAPCARDRAARVRARRTRRPRRRSRRASRSRRRPKNLRLAVARCPSTCRARRVVHEPGAAAARSAAARLRAIGEDVSEVLEYVPGRFKVIRHVRPKLACVRCERIVQAPAPSRGRSSAACPGRGCWPMCWCPSTATTCRCTGRATSTPATAWTSTARRWPTGSAGRRAARAAGGGARAATSLAGAKLHADDTPVPVLDPGRGRDQDRAAVGLRARRPPRRRAPSRRRCWFRYSPDRKGEHPANT